MLDHPTPLEFFSLQTMILDDVPMPFFANLMANMLAPALAHMRNGDTVTVPVELPMFGPMQGPPRNPDAMGDFGADSGDEDGNAGGPVGCSVM